MIPKNVYTNNCPLPIAKYHLNRNLLKKSGHTVIVFTTELSFRRNIFCKYIQFIYKYIHRFFIYIIQILYIYNRFGNTARLCATSTYSTSYLILKAFPFTNGY